MGNLQPCAESVGKGEVLVHAFLGLLAGPTLVAEVLFCWHQMALKSSPLSAAGVLVAGVTAEGTCIKERTGP